MRRLLVVVVFSAFAANAQTPADLAAQLRAGESVNGFPNCGERPCYAAMPPLLWSEALNHSARFHASEMANQNYFSHDSKCTVVQNINSLYPTACDGSASCACVGGAAACATG